MNIGRFLNVCVKFPFRNAKNLTQMLGILAAALVLCQPGLAQLNLGTITGTVTDQTGGVVVGAAVSVVDVDRGVTRMLTSDGAGEYSAPSLTPGTYTVHVEAKGFQTASHEGITLQVGQFVRVDMQLKPGEQTQTVTVTGDLPMVDTSSAQLGGVLENLSIEELPVNGRDYQYMLEDRPGIVQFRAGGDDSFSGNGAGTMDNAWMFDGLYDVNFFAGGASIVGAGNIGPDGTSILPLDAIQEVVVTEVPKAEFGWKYGAHINVGLKSGTNSLHGTAYAYGRDTGLDARNPYLTSNLPDAPLTLEQYGASIGGPIKKDKVFYFLSYEGQRYTAGSPRLVNEPTTADLTGVTTSATSNSIPDAVYDMLHNPAAIAAGSMPSALSLNLAGCTGLVPAGSVTPAGTLSKAQVAVLGAETTAQLASGCNAAASLFGSYGGTATSYVTDFIGNGGSNNGVGKIDWHPNDHNTINGEYYQGGGPAIVPGAAIEPYWEESLAIGPKVSRAVWVWTPNSNWVNDARFGEEYDTLPIYNNECQHPQGVPNYAALGFIAGNLPCNAPGGGYEGGIPVYGGFPSITFPSFTALGDVASIQQEQNLWYLSGEDSVSYTHGKHIFKFGGEFRYDTFEGAGNFYGRGTIGFGSTAAWASNSAIPGCISTACSAATPLEDFMAGVPASATVLTGQQYVSYHFKQYAMFAQDDWRILPRLTLNLGIRDEYTGPIYSVGNRDGNFIPGLPNDPTGLVQETSGNALYKNAPTAFAPRVGLAWDVTGKGNTVVRAGFNIMYSSVPSLKAIIAGSAQLESTPTGYTFYNPNGTTFAGPGNELSGTFTATNGNIPWAVNVPVFNAVNTSGLVCGTGVLPVDPPAGVNPAVAEPSPCPLEVINPYLKVPIIYYRTLGVTHAFTNNLSATVNYVGSHGGNTLGSNQYNNPTPGPKNTATNGFIEQDRRPYNTEYPFYNTISYATAIGVVNYDGLQTSLTQRISRGLNFTAAYTLSHSLSSGSSAIASEPLLSYGNSSTDVRNTFTYSMTYNVPGIKSPAQLLEGWRVNTTVILQSGFPLTPSDTADDLLGTGASDPWILVGTPKDFDPSLGGAGAGVPCWGVVNSSFAKQSNCATVPTIANMPAICRSAAAAAAPSPSNVPQTSPNLYTATLALGSIGCYTEGASAMVPTAQGVYGTIAPGAFYDKGFHNWNLSFTKTFKFRERYSADFRMDFFNVLNRTSYASPSVTLSSPQTFGQAASTPDTSNPVIGNGARKIQLGLKLTF